MTLKSQCLRRALSTQPISASLIRSIHRSIRRPTDGSLSVAFVLRGRAVAASVLRVAVLRDERVVRQRVEGQPLRRVFVEQFGNEVAGGLADVAREHEFYVFDL